MADPKPTGSRPKPGFRRYSFDMPEELYWDIAAHAAANRVEFKDAVVTTLRENIPATTKPAKKK